MNTLRWDAIIPWRTRTKSDGSGHLDWIFKAHSDGANCAQAYWPGIWGPALVAAMLCALFVIVLWGLRGRLGAGPFRQVSLLSPMLVIGFVALVTLLPLVAGKSAHSINLVGSDLVFERCIGPVAQSETVSVAAMSDFRYILRTARVAVPVSELHFDVDGQANDWVIPLRGDSGQTNLEALAKILPAAVVEDYTAKLAL